jgi:tight adherence protein B
MIFKYAGFLLVSIGLFMAGMVYGKRFLEWLRFQSIGTRDYIVERLQLMFIEIDPQRVLYGQLILSFGFGFLVFALMIPNWAPGLIFGSLATVVGWKLPKPIVDWIYKRRVEKFVFQMIDGLNLMANGLKSGLSVVQALALVVQEMPDPIRQEFNLVLSENKLGVSLEEAFNNLAKRVKTDDVEMFVTAVNILKETGGNLAETFDTITTTLRERIKVEKKIQAMTASGFYQGMIVMAIPPVLGLLVYITDPEMMMPLFTTFLGWMAILGILFLELLGFFVIMKIVRIEV